MHKPVIEAAVEMVLTDLRPSGEAQEAEREALVASLRQLDAEQARLVSLAAQGTGDVPVLAAAIREREQRRAELRRRIEALEQRVEPLDLRRIEREAWNRVRGWRAVLRRQTAQARGCCSSCSTNSASCSRRGRRPDGAGTTSPARRAHGACWPAKCLRRW